MFKVHRLVYHLILGSRLIKKKRRINHQEDTEASALEQLPWMRAPEAGLHMPGPPPTEDRAGKHQADDHPGLLDHPGKNVCFSEGLQSSGLAFKVFIRLLLLYYSQA